MDDVERGDLAGSEQQSTEHLHGDSPNFQSGNTRKFLFISSSGGGTHNALVSAVKGYWNEEHPPSTSEVNVEMQIAQAFTDIIHSFDIFPTLTWDRYTGEDLFNWLNSQKANYVITCLYYVSQNHWLALRPFLVRRVMKYFEKQKPDIVLSAVPLLNFVFAEAAQRMDIPFILIPADADPAHYVRGVKDYDKLRVVVTHPRPPVLKRLKNISPSHQIQCNYPVRPTFLRPCPLSPAALREKWRVPMSAHTVGILMGGGGSHALTQYVKCLSKLEFPVVIMPCTGRSEHLVEVLSKIPTSKNVTIKPIGYISSEEQMCEFFDVCEVLILKPGPSSVREALARFKYGPGNLRKVLLDKTSKVQPWEEDNVSQCTTLRVGLPVYNIDHTDHLLRQILNQPHKKVLKMPDLQSPYAIVKEIEKLTNYPSQK